VTVRTGSERSAVFARLRARVAKAKAKDGHSAQEDAA